MSVIWVIALFLVLDSHGNGTEASRHRHSRRSQSTSEAQPYRTAFHFQPPKNWMNDPNGPMYYNGVYHLFYQYNPYSAVWGNISWGHSISYDLVDWVHLDIALNPTDPFDINGCWSGSATFLYGNKPVILYTGADTQNRQVQNLAFPKNYSDPFLVEWTKCPHNPLMSPVNDLDPLLFRDPTTAWLGPDKLWRVLVGAQINGSGMAIIYKSEDFVTWKRANPLHSSTKTKMWECPDFYPVVENTTFGSEFNCSVGEDHSRPSTKHVLKASFNDRDHYILGKYEPEMDKFVVESDFLDGGSDLRYDYGKFYASKSFYDSGKRRRVLWGWITESDSVPDDKSKGWSGVQSFPRSIVLSGTGRQLVQWPIKEIEKLRGKKVSLQDKELKSGSRVEISGVTASQADVEVSFDVLGVENAETMDPKWVDPQLLCTQKNASVAGQVGPFGFMVLASKDLTEQTAIFFRIFKTDEKLFVLMCSDQSSSSLREGLDKTIYGTFVDLDPRREKITLRSLIDHSIVESFGGEGRSCITSRVYPKLAINKEARLHAFNNGIRSVKISTLNAWSMKSARLAPLKNRRRPVFG